MAEKFPINIWINEDRLEKLRSVGLAGSCEDALAGMKVLRIHCDKEQMDALLKLYPVAKYDSATTKSIELLPAEVKSAMFDLVIDKKNTDITGEFLKSVK